MTSHCLAQLCVFGFFNWRITVLQYRVGLCHASTWISHRYTYIPFVLNLPPTSHPIQLSATAAAAAKSLQSCPTLCDPIDGNPPGSPVPGILQARTQEWVALSFSNAWKWKVKVKSLSRVWLLATAWTAAHQAPPSMGFSRQEYWSGVPLPSPRAELGWCKNESSTDSSLQQLT